ncbi:MAG: hypothetical protein KatS3mg031_1015 [Chitinophagales bacterium]|nr:MAG: hypothetical protein KatS3mg031_1015 [Chitinophagales bacterium]
MSKIINLQEDFSRSPHYREALKKAIESLQDIREDLFHSAVNLSVTGKWKAWSEQQPEGTVFAFNTESLKSSGDKNVILICNLIEEVDNVKTDLESKKGL